MVALLLALSVLLQGAPAVRTGVVTGQLQSRDGTPAAAVRVFALGAPPPGVRPEDGTQYYTVPPPASTAITDDQGRYRLANIPPGRYYIVAGLLGQATYYPSVADADRATVVTVTPGSSATIDFKLVMQLGGRVSGRVTPANPAVPEKAVLSGVKFAEVIEMPVAADGTFDFGHLPRGSYLLNLFPLIAAMPSLAFDVGDTDVTSLQLVRPTLHTVSGRIVVQNGPLPNGLLAFYTPQTYVAATINPDGTFQTRLHSARHLADIAGMPGGYRLATVRLGSRDVSDGLDVKDADVSGVVITVSAPRGLPRVHGRISGMSPGTSASAVEMRGPIIGVMRAPVMKDGSFAFAAVTPGLYELTVPSVAGLTPLRVVVGWDDVEVPVSLTPAR